MGAAGSPARPSLLRTRVRAFWAGAASRVGLVVALAILTMALWPKAWLLHDPTLIDLGAAKRPGLWAGDLAHPLGTDFLGRDLVARSIFATRLTLVISGSAVLLAAVIGIGLGLAAGFYRGWVDEVVSWLVDVQLAFPVIALAVAIVAIVKGGLVTLIVVLAVTSWSTMARVVRAQALSARTEPYVEAARALGCPTDQILARHILPNITSAIVVQATVQIPTAIIAEAVLSFLGLGVQPPAPSWGTMLNAAQQFLEQAPWMAIWPGAAIFLLALSFNLAGDGLRDVLDPRDY